jgi:hypothetical protein
MAAFFVEGSSSNIGIGHNTPTADSSLAGVSVPAGTKYVHIHDGDGAVLKLSDPSDGSNRGAQFAMIGTTTILNNCESGPITFGTGNTERGRFEGSGKFRLNTTANQVMGYELFTCNGAAGFKNGDASVVGVWQTQSDAFAMQFFSGSGGTNVGSISVTASATAFNTSSDYRLKENVTGITNATDRLKQLNPVRFNFIADADTTVDGFLAHEVSDIVPEAISGEKDAMKDEQYEVTPAVLDDDGNEVTPAEMGTRTVPEYQGIDQSKLVPLLVATIQELEARIAALETN